MQEKKKGRKRKGSGFNFHPSNFLCYLIRDILSNPHGFLTNYKVCKVFFVDNSQREISDKSDLRASSVYLPDIQLLIFFDAHVDLIWLVTLGDAAIHGIGKLDGPGTFGRDHILNDGKDLVCDVLRSVKERMTQAVL